MTTINMPQVRHNHAHCALNFYLDRGWANACLPSCTGRSDCHIHDLGASTTPKRAEPTDGCGCARLGLCQSRPNCDLYELHMRERPVPGLPGVPGTRTAAEAYPFAPGIIEPAPRDDGWFWPTLQRLALLVAVVGVAGFCAGLLTGCFVP